MTSPVEIPAARTAVRKRSTGNPAHTAESSRSGLPNRVALVIHSQPAAIPTNIPSIRSMAPRRDEAYAVHPGRSERRRASLATHPRPRHESQNNARPTDLAPKRRLPDAPLENARTTAPNDDPRRWRGAPERHERRALGDFSKLRGPLPPRSCVVSRRTGCRACRSTLHRSDLVPLGGSTLPARRGSGTASSPSLGR